MDQTKLPEMLTFLENVSEENEDTDYDTSDEHLVNDIIALVKEQGHTSIIEDFNQPFLHPMITVQKWVAELKQIVREEIGKKSPLY